MVEAAFVVTGILYFLIAMKTIEWQTLSILGMSLCTPELFILKPHRYQFLCIGLFWITAGLCIWFSAIPWWIGLIAVVALYMLSHTRGRIQAFRIFRAEMIDALKYEEDPTHHAYLISEAKKSNSQLVREIREHAAHALRRRAS